MGQILEWANTLIEADEKDKHTNTSGSPQGKMILGLSANLYHPCLTDLHYLNRNNLSRIDSGSQ